MIFRNKNQNNTHSHCHCRILSHLIDAGLRFGTIARDVGGERGTGIADDGIGIEELCIVLSGVVGVGSVDGT